VSDPDRDAAGDVIQIRLLEFSERSPGRILREGRELLGDVALR
jgi:hypothetical protein